MKSFGLMVVVALGGCLESGKGVVEDPSTSNVADATVAPVETAEPTETVQPIEISEPTTTAPDVTVPDTTVHGTPRGCPTSFETGVVGDEGVPQTKLRLKADFAPDEYTWSVAQPNGSISLFQPTATVSDPTYEANVAGVYSLSLASKFDGHDCQPVAHIFYAVPASTLHVELLWTTPGDDDETNEGAVAGTDLDLHFMHPFAEGWFSNQWDCFWNNEHPNWQNFNPSVDDDPDLDRDDTDGGGPENINLDWLEPEACYRIGVHFWEDNQFGRARATVRVYRDASLVFEQSEWLVKNDLWSVTRICTDLAEPQPFEGCEPPCITHGYQNDNMPH